MMGKNGLKTGFFQVFSLLYTFEQQFGSKNHTFQVQNVAVAQWIRVQTAIKLGACISTF